MDNEKSLLKVSDHLFNGISNIINVTRSKVAVYVNSQASMMFWHIGEFIINELNYETYSAYGDNILATLSQRLTEKYGKGYSYSALTRMIKVATIYNDEQMFATLSQTLSWGHFIELITIKNDIKRLYYQQMGITEHWSVRELREQQDKLAYERSLIAAKPENEIITALKNTTPEHLDPDVVFKNSYIIDFLCLSNDYSESDLEDVGEGLPVPNELKNIRFDFRYDISAFYNAHPYLNASKLAKYLNINASLMRQYKRGQYISEEQLLKIQNGIRLVGKELSTIVLLK